MEMEALEEFTGSNDHTQIVKGKRTKRLRPSSPFGLAVTSSSSSGGVGGGGSGSSGGDGGGGGDVCSSIPSPTYSGDISASTEEDEDMANCLILLAQGGCPRPVEEEVKIEKFSSRRFAEMATTTTGKAGFYVYECKTCNRSFPSFQALGGHRASHKKPKVTAEDKKIVVAPPVLDDVDYEKEGQYDKMSPPFSLHVANKPLHGNSNKPKIHGCSICGSEFSSGQALGGHMRRHRSPTATRITMSMEASTTDSSHADKKPRNILSLDLNLPAPDDDPRDSKFQFTANQQHLVFSAPALVDCHY